MTVTFMMEKQVFRGHTVKFLAKKWCDGVVLAARFVLRGAAVVSCSTDTSDCRWSVYLPLLLSLLSNDLSGHFDADDEGKAYDGKDDCTGVVHLYLVHKAR